VLISKNIGFSELLIDPTLGRIWVNSPNCVLRINGIKFKNQREKFSMIDINGSEGVMIEGDLSTSKLNSFIEKIINLAILNNFSDEFMNDTLKLIEYSIDKEKK